MGFDFSQSACSEFQEQDQLEISTKLNETLIQNKESLSQCEDKYCRNSNCGSTDDLTNISLSDLTWCKTLGSGAFGRVDLVTENNNTYFAMKKVRKTRTEAVKKHVTNERKIM